MIAFTTARDEEECIAGWVRQAQCLADRVVVLIDPRTKDRTGKIAQELGAELYIQQIAVQEPLTNWHYNQNLFIQNEIEMDEWFVFYDADERLMPEAIQMMRDAFDAHKNEDYESFCVKEKVEYYPDESHIVDWGVPLELTQPFYFKKRPYLKRGLVHHSSFIIDLQKRYLLPITCHHYSKVKDSKDAFKVQDKVRHSDYQTLMRINNGTIPVKEYQNPIPNWRTMQ